MTGEAWRENDRSRFLARPENTELLLPLVMHGLQKMIALVIGRVLTVLSCADYTQLGVDAGPQALRPSMSSISTQDTLPRRSQSLALRAFEKLRIKPSSE